MRKRKILKNIFSVTSIIIIAKILGFIKQMITASTFGATIKTDLISLSQGFIGNLEYLLFQTLITSFLPVYICVKESGKENEQQFVSDTIKLFIIISVGIMIGIMIGAPVFARIIAPSYSIELSQQLSKYIVVFSILLVFLVLIALFRALLNANERFVPGELIGVNQSIIVIIMISLFSNFYGVNVLVVSSFIYSIWNVFFLGLLSRKQWRITKGNPLRNSNVRRMLQMIPPLLLGYAMVYVNQLVDKILISGLESGAVTAMSYASTLSSLVATFIASFCSVLFTYVTKNIVKHNHKNVAEISIRASIILLTVFLPISILTILCAEDIVRIVFARGAFEQVAVKNAACALAGYSFMFVPYAFRELFGQFQYGYQDSKRPMINSTIGIVFNIVFSIILCPKLGVFGVAFATSVSVVICGILNVYSAKRHNKYLEFKCFFNKIPLWICGSLVCFFIVKYGIEQWREKGALVRFCLTVLSSFCGYFLVVSPILWKEIHIWRKLSSERNERQINDN